MQMMSSFFIGREKGVDLGKESREGSRETEEVRCRKDADGRTEAGETHEPESNAHRIKTESGGKAESDCGVDGDIDGARRRSGAVECHGREDIFGERDQDDQKHEEWEYERKHRLIVDDLCDSAEHSDSGAERGRADQDFSGDCSDGRLFHLLRDGLQGRFDQGCAESDCECDCKNEPDMPAKDDQTMSDVFRHRLQAHIDSLLEAKESDQHQECADAGIFRGIEWRAEGKFERNENEDKRSDRTQNREKITKKGT